MRSLFLLVKESTHTSGPNKMADDHDDFEQAQSGASATFPRQCSALRKNEFVVIKDKPCKIVDMSTSKTGKHGHAKVHLVALDIFTGKKYEDVCPSTHNMNVPNVTRNDLQCLDLSDDGYLSLMDENGTLRDDLKMPEAEELKNQILEHIEKGIDFYVTVLKAMDTEQVVALKLSK